MPRSRMRGARCNNLPRLHQFLRSIDGLGQLWAANGQFLGVLSSSQYDPNSICNPNGIYGSSWSATSIRTEYSMYGSEYSTYSPYNSYCLNPPAIIYQNQVVLIVTRNRYAVTNGVQVIDPIFCSLHTAATLTQRQNGSNLHLSNKLLYKICSIEQCCKEKCCDDLLKCVVKIWNLL